jgi:hypothetical protein
MWRRVGRYEHTDTSEAPTSQTTWRHISEDRASRDQLKSYITVSYPPHSTNHTEWVYAIQ